MIILLSLWLLLVPTLSLAKPNSPQIINLLLVADHAHGENYPTIRETFESYSTNFYTWNITTTGLYEKIHYCSFQPLFDLTPDILLQNITDITKFDCLSILPGRYHEGLRSNATALKLIRDAVSKGLIVTAWCRAVGVLAKADIIWGKNITGHAKFESEYLAAGAIYTPDSPPIRDGNIITSGRAWDYLNETCELIASACYEKLGIDTNITTNTSVPAWISATGLLACIVITITLSRTSRKR
ncbi:MAG: DJ-1/PfpI family protein [Candidatus Hodarchaeota archaeon]